MTIYYVGIGGSDAANGQSWANRKETLNGAEDLPVAPSDTVYVGPGTYRELLTVDVEGTSGNEITYIADVTGINTDEVGGRVLITGSDDDQTVTRARCIYSATLGSYRVFRGFRLEMAINQLFYLHQPDGTIFEYCVFGESISGQGYRYAVSSDDSWGDSTATFRNCLFLEDMSFTDASAPNTALVNFENCLFLNMTGSYRGITANDLPIDVNNCTFMWWGKGIDVSSTVAGGSVDLTNCIFTDNAESYDESSGGILNVDYCNDSNYYWTPGGIPTVTNSNNWHALMSLPLLAAGYRFPHTHGLLEDDSHLKHIAGNGSEETADMWGMTRPTTSAKKSWGAMQFTDIHFEETIKQTSLASVEMRDAEREYAYIRLRAPITTVKVKVYWEANYAGTNPQVVIKVPGLATVTKTAIGSAESWNQINTGVGPTDMPYALLELVSNNTSSTGDFKVYWDDFEISP